jgi:hypothetical protein
MARVSPDALETVEFGADAAGRDHAMGRLRSHTRQSTVHGQGLAGDERGIV